MGNEGIINKKPTRTILPGNPSPDGIPWACSPNRIPAPNKPQHHRAFLLFAEDLPESGLVKEPQAPPHPNYPSPRAK